MAPGITEKYTVVSLQTHLENVEVIPLTSVKILSFALPGFIGFEIIVLFV